MTNSFRIDATELTQWRAVLADRLGLRGVPAIAKEMEAHLAQKAGDGTVVVTRHQLFTWAEALHGVAARDPTGGLAPVVADMRSILSGKPAGAPVPAPSPVAHRPSPSSAHAPPPPVVYASQAAATLPAQAAGGHVFSGATLGEAVREALRSATREVYVSSPWPTGIETLLSDINALAPSIRLLILSRRPERDDAAFHQAMDSLGRRRAVTAWSPYVQTRMVIVDGTRAIVGAASVPGAASREVGLLVTDPATVAALKAQFERAHAEAAGGTY